MKKYKVPFFIAAISDNEGNHDFVVFDEMSDCIQICGLIDYKGDNAYFESEAYHLKKWCEDNNFKYVCEGSVYEITI